MKPFPIIIASNNSGKIAELKALLAGYPFELKSQNEFAIISPPETGLSFVENALIKARHAARTSGLPAIADDSGLVVPALKGEPGIYSARYAGENANDEHNIRKLLNNMQNLHDEKHRGAYFRCAIVYINTWNDPVPLFAKQVGKA